MGVLAYWAISLFLNPGCFHYRTRYLQLSVHVMRTSIAAVRTELNTCARNFFANLVVIVCATSCHSLSVAPLVFCPMTISTYGPSLYLVCSSLSDFVTAPSQRGGIQITNYRFVSSLTPKLGVALLLQLVYRMKCHRPIKDIAGFSLSSLVHTP